MHSRLCLAMIVPALVLTACSGGGGGSSSSSSKPGTLVPSASGGAASASTLSGDFSAMAASIPIYSSSIPADVDGAAPVLNVARGFFRGAGAFDMYSCMAAVLSASDLAAGLFDGSTHIISGGSVTEKYRVKVVKSGSEITSFELDSATSGVAQTALRYSVTAGTATATFANGADWLTVQGTVAGGAWTGTKTMRFIGTDPNASNAAVEMTIVQAGNAMSVEGTHGTLGDFYARTSLEGTTLWNLKMGHGAAKSDFTVTNNLGMSGVVGWSDAGADAVANTSSHYANVNSHSLSTIDHTANLTATWDGTGTVEAALTSYPVLAQKILACEDAYIF